jgi:Fe-S cluster assembly protein SufB
MLEFRLGAFEQYLKMPMPSWGVSLEGLDLERIRYYASAGKGKTDAWDAVPKRIKDTFDRIGIPEAERRFLSGTSAQYDSEVVYHNLKKSWEDQGIVFLDMDSGLKRYPDLVREHFGSIVPPGDNKFAALNSAVWSGGSFIHVPEDVKVEVPLQTYFRINVKDAGQFERTLIILEKGASVHYIEGCSAPVYSSAALHSAVVEIIAKEGAHVRYTTIQNWSDNVYNLVTKRALAHKDSLVQWVDGNIGSKATMKYPSIILAGERARGEVLTVAFAGKGQHQDTGAKMIHLAPKTSSQITAKSVCQGGGRSSYRGLVKIKDGADGCRSFVQCDAYLLDGLSRTDTYPDIRVDDKSATIGHEAKVGRISKDKLFYLMSRGIQEKEALAMIVLGFMDAFTKELPMEYALELNRLIELQLEESVG